MFGVAAGMVLAVADFRVLTGVIYPTYLFAADAAMVIMILGSPHYQAARPTDRVIPPGTSRAPMRLSAASAQWRPVTGRDWRQSDLGPAVPQQRVPDYDAPQPWPGSPQPWPGPPRRARDHGRALRVRDHGRPFRTAEPTSW
jgi:hypothetical protein